MTKLIDNLSCPLPKRTRLNVKQSKNGCYTCKARRVKCDEKRPCCLRCQSAGKTCLGYTEVLYADGRQAEHNVHLQDSSAQELSSSAACSITDDSNLYLSQISKRDLRNYTLGIDVLLSDSLRAGSSKTLFHWACFLNQTSSTSHVVQKAVVYFGAVCAEFLNAPNTRRALTILSCNAAALKALMREIVALPDGLIPITLTCIILAATEVLLRRLTGALVHIRGAIDLLSYSEHKYTRSTSPEVLRCHPRIVKEYKDPLRAILLGMDMHTAWYRLGEPPDIPQSFNVATDSILSNSEEQVAMFLHDCYHFANRIAHFKYHYQSQIPALIWKEQRQYVSILQMWLDARHDASLGRDKRLEKRDQSELILEVQVLSTLIYLGTILQPYECAYDSYSRYFGEILDISEYLLLQHYDSCHPTGLPKFHLQPTIFQPLYFTSIKYRCREQRRRAMKLFTQLGPEGPWNANIMAGIASRVIEIEETAVRSSELGDHSHFEIAENVRIHGNGVMSQSAATFQYPIVIEAEFSQCTNVDAMLEVPESERAGYWRIWTESIMISDYV